MLAGTTVPVLWREQIPSPSRPIQLVCQIQEARSSSSSRQSSLALWSARAWWLCGCLWVLASQSQSPRVDLKCWAPHALLLLRFHPKGLTTLFLACSHQGAGLSSNSALSASLLLSLPWGRVTKPRRCLLIRQFLSLLFRERIVLLLPLHFSHPLLPPDPVRTPLSALWKRVGAPEHSNPVRPTSRFIQSQRASPGRTTVLFSPHCLLTHSFGQLLFDSYLVTRHQISHLGSRVSE